MDTYTLVKQLGKGGMGVAWAVRKKNTHEAGFLVLKQVTCRYPLASNSLAFHVSLFCDYLSTKPESFDNVSDR